MSNRKNPDSQPEQLALSALASITAILTSTLSRSKPPIVPPTVTLATDVLLALSLLASGVWLTLAATTTIDGNTALNIDFLTPSADITVKSAVEIVGIGLTFTTAYVVHTILSIFPLASFSPFLLVIKKNKATEK